MKLSSDPYALKVAAVLVLVGLVLFGASFNDPFHFDDVQILNDSNVTNPDRWHHFLNPLHLRQFTFFSFYLNHQVTGTSPGGYHVVNVMLHIANAALLFFLLARFVERWTAVGAAALFLVHPIQTEAVLYVYQRSVLLACFFSLLALIALAERRPWLAGVFFFCAFESKESALAVPFAAGVLYARLWAGDRPYRNRIILVSLSIALGAAALGLLAYHGEKTVGIGAASEVGPLDYFWTQTRVIYTYLRLLFFPYPQSIEYQIAAPNSILPLLGLLLIAFFAGFASTFRKWRVPALCVLVFFIFLAPTSSFVPSIDAAFEHRLYLPMLAFALFAASLCAGVPGRTWAGVALLAVLGILTVQRGQVWATDAALWEDATQRAPGKARAWFNLGGAYLDSDPVKARAALLRGLEIRPEFPEALYNLGVIEQKRGNWSGAVNYYERAIASGPGYWPAWNNLGNTLFTMGERSRALECFESTLNLNRDYWPAQYNIAILHYTNGQFEKALPRLRTVLDWRPEFVEARRLLATALTRAGRRVEAEVEWKKLGEIAATESRNTPTMILAPAGQ